MLKSYKSEQEYKMNKIRELCSNPVISTDYVLVESPLTASGFPDLLLQRVHPSGKKKYYFIEFKISDESGAIKFQNTQPAYYRRHSTFPFLIFAFNRKTGREVHFTTKALFNPSHKYYLNNTLRLRL